MVDAEPLICVRFSRRDPKDAAAARAILERRRLEHADGRPAGQERPPSSRYHVRFWQVGNERRGQDYEARLAAFCQAMKKADPSIELMSSYPDAGRARTGRPVAQLCLAAPLRMRQSEGRGRRPELGAEDDRRARQRAGRSRSPLPSGTRPPATGARAGASSGAWPTPWHAHATIT